MTLYSQVNTVDSVVVLSKRVAVLVLQDLERLNNCDSLNALGEIKIDNLINQKEIQKSIIRSQKKQIDNLHLILINKDSVRKINKRQILFYQKEVRKQKRQKYIVGSIGVLLIILVGF